MKSKSSCFLTRHTSAHLHRCRVPLPVCQGHFPHHPCFPTAYTFPSTVSLTLGKGIAPYEDDINTRHMPMLETARWFGRTTSGMFNEDSGDGNAPGPRVCILFLDWQPPSRVTWVNWLGFVRLRVITSHPWCRDPARVKLSPMTVIHDRGIFAMWNMLHSLLAYPNLYPNIYINNY